MGMLSQHCETPSLALVTESLDALAVLKKTKGRVKRWLRQRLCFAISGGHELYRSHTDTKIYQENAAGSERVVRLVARRGGPPLPREVLAIAVMLIRIIQGRNPTS